MRPLAVWLVVLGACGRIGFAPLGGDDTGGDGDGGNGNGDGGLFDAPPIPTGANIAFITSTLQTGAALGGIVGGDQLCNDRAQAAGLPGSYIAWISSSTASARGRLGTSRGWVGRSNLPFADSIPELINGHLFYPLTLDENGMPVTSGPIMTGTDSAGFSTGADCAGFTADGAITLGILGSTTHDWTEGDGDLTGCAVPSHLYCLGIGSTMPVAVPAVAHRNAFLTFGTFDNVGGRPNADSLCQAEAAAASLAGTYRALLALHNESAVQRFDLGGLPWARPDGALVVASASDLATGTLLTSNNVTPNGTYIAADAVSFGGTSPTSANNDDTLTCADWTDSTGAFAGGHGFANATSSIAFSGVASGCSTPARLYCLQL